jgi:hypothetical protein
MAGDAVSHKHGSHVVHEAERFSLCPLLFDVVVLGGSPWIEVEKLSKKTSNRLSRPNRRLNIVLLDRL